MKPIVTWVVLANSRTARVFENRGPGKGLHVVADKVWEASPAKPYSSEAGVGHSIAGPGRSAVDQGDPQEQADIRFAKDIMKALELAQRQKSFDRLILVAGPHMLGLLRKALSDSLRAMVVAELANDLTAVSDADLVQHIGRSIAL